MKRLIHTWPYFCFLSIIALLAGLTFESIWLDILFAFASVLFFFLLSLEVIWSGKKRGVLIITSVLIPVLLFAGVRNVLLLFN
ncbi:hypothetical protein JOC54_003991 [Alkalihalobacillus xiaoxiensis]|uniref:Uncharacterized protein n=1 Tax=Shouchella xiaoxiensis TaxID=766895 RepID=A0ABS2SYU2_9BACI|nr:hypothetical protein [Shouchella xiaoxiensis]MBM7840698.1 hypothetical protein [Shouchella xiaoxiensis]